MFSSPCFHHHVFEYFMATKVWRNQRRPAFHCKGVVERWDSFPWLRQSVETPNRENAPGAARWAAARDMQNTERARGRLLEAIAEIILYY